MVAIEYYGLPRSKRIADTATVVSREKPRYRRV